MKEIFNVGLATALFLLPVAYTSAVQPPQTLDRSQYNLFKPTPLEQMRDFVPDRPNVTDGPYTVDPGHFLLAVGLFEYARDRYNDERVRLDNDAGPIAIGLIPFVTFPTGQNGLGNRGFAGGMGVPAQFALPAGFQLGIETTVQTIHETGGGSHFDYLNSISLGHAINKKLSTYVELATDVSTAAHIGWIGTVDTALVYQPINNWHCIALMNASTKSLRRDVARFSRN